MLDCNGIAIDTKSILYFEKLHIFYYSDKCFFDERTIEYSWLKIYLGYSLMYNCYQMTKKFK